MKGRKTRLNLELSVKTREQLKSIQTKGNCASLSEVIRLSVALCDLVLDRYADDGVVTFKRADGSEEKIMIFK